MDSCQKVRAYLSIYKQFLYPNQMFFARQHSNQCGLHAIQNMFKSAAIKKEDMSAACVKIETETGDPVLNHESFGGDWSVAAIVTTLESRGYHVYRAVESRQQREWAGESLPELLQNEQFRGIILHLPINRHFACLRPEQIEGQRHLYYVDSQSSGPRRILPKLAERRCLEPAYSWEPYVVIGDEIEYVAPLTSHTPSLTPSHLNRPRVRPSAEFMANWNALDTSRIQIDQKQ